MNNSKLLKRHAFILDILCLLLCFALLYLGNANKLPYWALAVGAMVALVALVASLYLIIKARKIDHEESRRIEREILENAAKEDGGYIPEDDKEPAIEVKEPVVEEQVVEEAAADEEQEDYKSDDEQ
jgi:hypothetical protein